MLIRLTILAALVLALFPQEVGEIRSCNAPARLDVKGPLECRTRRLPVPENRAGFPTHGLTDLSCRIVPASA